MVQDCIPFAPEFFEALSDIAGDLPFGGMILVL